MRLLRLKRSIAAAAGATLLGAAAIASAATTQDYSQAFTRATAKASTGIEVAIASVDPDNPRNSQPSPLRRLALELPAGTRVDDRGARRCGASDIDFAFEGRQACPRASRVGSGIASARFPSADVRDSDIAVTVFNARRSLILFLEPDVSNPFVLRARFSGPLRDGPTLTVVVPPNCLPPARERDGACRHPATGEPGDEVAIQSLRFATRARSQKTGGKRRTLIRTPATCAGAWTFAAAFAYRDPAQDRAVERAQPCASG